MATTTTYNQNGLAEDFENMIFDVSPTDTPLLTAAKRKTAKSRFHQWQEDSLAAAADNAALEGADASFTTAAATTVLGNYCQISTKTVEVSETVEAVDKYGRKSEMARLLVKHGKELKRDIEYGLVRNSASTSGAQASARTSAGIESWLDSLNGNTVKATGNTTHTTPGYVSGTVAAPTDGTQVTFIEADLKTALGNAWTDGGDVDTIMMSTTNKAEFDAFAGVSTKYNEVKSGQHKIIGAADIYVSSYGNHKAVLNRYMRDEAVLCLDTDYVSVAWLRPIAQTDIARVGDGERKQITAEWTLVVDNRNAHAKIASVGA